jgi:MFS family permease
VGAILLLNSLNLEKQKARLTIWQSILYFLLIASNPLFSPLLLYGLVTLTVDLIGKISRHNWRLIVLNLNFALRIVLPLIYLSFISLPFLFQNNQYRLDPLASFVSNLQFYSQTDGLFLFIILLFFGLFFLTVFFQLSKARNFQTLSLMLSGLAILFIVLVQKSQQQTHYLIVPVLLVVPTLIQYFVGKTRQHLSKSSLVIGLVFLLLIPYNMTYSVRSYFMSSPWGSSVKQFHNEVMKLDLVGRDVCVRDGSGLEDWKSFIAQIGGENFFTRREVGAKSAIFITTDECPKGLDSRALSVLQLPDGSFTTE